MAKQTTFRVMLALAQIHNLRIHQLDVDNAFLYIKDIIKRFDSLIQSHDQRSYANPMERSETYQVRSQADDNKTSGVHIQIPISEHCGCITLSVNEHTTGHCICSGSVITIL